MTKKLIFVHRKIGKVACSFPGTALFEWSAGIEIDLPKYQQNFQFLGFLFGMIGGVIVVDCGKTLGATMSFFLARTLLQSWVEAKLQQNEKYKRSITK